MKDFNDKVQIVEPEGAQEYISKGTGILNGLK